MRSALVVGGTGPTGPAIVRGLLDAGYRVTILHRGLHEPPELPVVQHVHADPFDAASLKDALSGRSFDVVMAMYGRTRLVADELGGRCGQFIGVGGVPVYAGRMEPDSVHPYGMRVLADEHSPRASAGSASSYAAAIVRTEDVVFEHHRKGHFVASWFRYPYLYGPRSPQRLEWPVLQRLRDGRRALPLPDDGLTILSRGYSENVAHAVLLAIDNPAAAGEVFNCADDLQLTMRQWVELVMDAAGGELELISVPWELTGAARNFFTESPAHALVDTSKLRKMLGYQDLVPVPESIHRSVEWLLQNPPPEGEVKQVDYEAEDALIAAYRQAVEKLAQYAAGSSKVPTG